MLGWFDPEMRDTAWFDPEEVKDLPWWDRELVEAPTTAVQDDVFPVDGGGYYPT